ncbi:MAG: LysE family translocator [Pseudohongiellaceae bacterium]
MEYLAIIAFAITTCVTPGPNNAMIMASGLNYGIRRSMPHYAGIILGFPLMVLAVGLGIAQLFDIYPVMHLVLKLVGAAYLSYLAYKIASAPVSESAVSKGKPFTFVQAAAFQWVNPKAWVLAVGATVTYTTLGDGYVLQVLTIGLIFMLFGAPCILLWLWGGASLKALMKTPVYVRIFNISMALLLMGSLVPVFIDLYWQLTA